MADQPEPCTNYGATRRHYSTNLMPSSSGRTGREGTALCGGARPVEVWDEVGINSLLAQWRQGKPAIVVADLPECKLCARAKAKLEASRG